MPATIKIKNSSTSGAVPTASDLVQGELAVNVADLGLYTENASGTVVKLNAPSIDDKNTGATKHLTISTGGNLGLGVTPSAWGSPFKAFQFGSNGGSLNYRTDSNQAVELALNWFYDGTNSKYINSNWATRYRQFSGAHEWYTAASGTAGANITFTQAMTLDASGNLVVGGTSANVYGASKAITLNATAGNSCVYEYTVNGTSTGYFGGGSGSTWIGSKTSIPLIMYTGDTERARIDSSGNLLVGTTSASGKLTVSTSGVSNGVYSLNTDSSGTNHTLFLGRANGADRFYVLGNGNVQNTNNSYGALSDVKLKENITDATPKLSQLNQIRIVNYNLIGDTNKQIGVIAQELEQVFPSMVEETTDRDEEGNDLGTTTKSVKYSVFVPMLIKALQELDAKFEAYKASHP